MKRNAMLRDFLRSRRARVTPEEAGVPPGPGLRRVPGLRREEVAHLAGISVDYYVRFEQGRCPSVSDALLDSVAKILRLTPTERLYLYDIARAPSTPAPAGDQQISNGVRLLLDNLSTPISLAKPVASPTGTPGARAPDPQPRRRRQGCGRSPPGCPWSG